MLQRQSMLGRVGVGIGKVNPTVKFGRTLSERSQTRAAPDLATIGRMMEGRTPPSGHRSRQPGATLALAMGGGERRMLHLGISGRQTRTTAGRIKTKRRPHHRGREPRVGRMMRWSARTGHPMTWWVLVPSRPCPEWHRCRGLAVARIGVDPMTIAVR